MKRILVTGANGFVGRHLCERLVENGRPVVGAVRRSEATTELPPGVSPAVLGDLGSTGSREMQRELRDVRTIIHLAAHVHVPRNQKQDDREYWRVNVDGSLRLLQAAYAAGVQRFVYVSSVHAMSTQSDEILTEQSPCNPTTPYGASKLEAEQRLQEFADHWGMELVIVRPPPVYGPNHVGNLSHLFRAVQRGIPLPFKQLTSRRSLVYVGNLVDALLLCGNVPQAAGKTYLVSDGRAVSISELVQIVAGSKGKKPRLFSVPTTVLRWGGRIAVKRETIERLFGSLIVDDRLIRRQIHWQPQYSLRQGVLMTLGVRPKVANRRMAA
jgi:nucleoside-diphosphate-sugar epimerase